MSKEQSKEHPKLLLLQSILSCGAQVWENGGRCSMAREELGTCKCIHFFTQFFYQKSFTHSYPTPTFCLTYENISGEKMPQATKSLIIFYEKSA